MKDRKYIDRYMDFDIEHFFDEEKPIVMRFHDMLYHEKVIKKNDELLFPDRIVVEKIPIDAEREGLFFEEPESHFCFEL